MLNDMKNYKQKNAQLYKSNYYYSIRKYVIFGTALSQLLKLQSARYVHACKQMSRWPSLTVLSSGFIMLVPEQ
jgi:hypothetical protein